MSISMPVASGAGAPVDPRANVGAILNNSRFGVAAAAAVEKADDKDDLKAVTDIILAQSVKLLEKTASRAATELINHLFPSDEDRLGKSERKFTVATVVEGILPKDGADLRSIAREVAKTDDKPTNTSLMWGVYCRQLSRALKKVVHLNRNEQRAHQAVNKTRGNSRSNVLLEAIFDDASEALLNDIMLKKKRLPPLLRLAARGMDNPAIAAVTMATTHASLGLGGVAMPIDVGVEAVFNVTPLRMSSVAPGRNRTCYGPIAVERELGLITIADIMRVLAAPHAKRRLGIENCTETMMTPVLALLGGHMRDRDAGCSVAAINIPQGAIGLSNKAFIGDLAHEIAHHFVPSHNDDHKLFTAALAATAASYDGVLWRNNFSKKLLNAMADRRQNIADVCMSTAAGIGIGSLPGVMKAATASNTAPFAITHMLPRNQDCNWDIFRLAVEVGMQLKGMSTSVLVQLGRTISNHDYRKSPVLVNDPYNVQPDDFKKYILGGLWSNEATEARTMRKEQLIYIHTKYCAATSISDGEQATSDLAMFLMSSTVDFVTLINAHPRVKKMPFLLTAPPATPDTWHTRFLAFALTKRAMLAAFLTTETTPFSTRMLPLISGVRVQRCKLPQPDAIAISAASHVRIAAVASLPTPTATPLLKHVRKATLETLNTAAQRAVQQAFTQGLARVADGSVLKAPRHVLLRTVIDTVASTVHGFNKYTVPVFIGEFNPIKAAASCVHSKEVSIAPSTDVTVDINKFTIAIMHRATDATR